MPTCSLLSVFLLTLALSSQAQETPSDQEVIDGKKPLPGLKLELSGPPGPHPVGEAIPVTMTYSYSGSRKLSYECITYDRGGRIPFEFQATGEEGKLVRDPLQAYLFAIGGGLRGGGKLRPDQPYAQEVNVNEWLCFDKPGKYRLTARTSIVGFDDDDTGYPRQPIPLTSDALELEISAPNEKLRKAHLEEAEAALAGENPEQLSAAVQTLRFIVDERAIPLLIRALNHKAHGNHQLHAYFGLISFADLGPVKAAILKALDDPIQPLDAQRSLSHYAYLLAAAELQAANVTEEHVIASEPYKKWQATLTQKLLARVAKLPLAESVNAAVGALAMDPAGAGPAIWKRLLQHAALVEKGNVDRAAWLIEHSCREKPLVADLRAVVENEKLAHALRSAAIVALHAMGDDTKSPLVCEDLTALNPVFSDAAHATLGSADAELISARLGKLLDNGALTLSVARRVRDYGTRISYEKLRFAAQRQPLDGPFTTDALLEALALCSPEDSVLIIEGELNKRAQNEGRGIEIPIGLLCRIDTPPSREIIARLFKSPDQVTRQELLHCFELSVTAADLKQPYGSQAGRGLPGSRSLPEFFAAEVLQACKGDESKEVREAARRALIAISGIPKDGVWQPLSVEEQKKLPPQWEAWLARKAAER